MASGEALSKDGPGEERIAEARAAQVHLDGAYRDFASLSSDQVAERAAELKSAGTWGPMSRVARVAMAWSMLAAMMKKEGLETVGDLEPGAIVEQAERTWVIPPEEGLI
jgi:hypothetical protein